MSLPHGALRRAIALGAAFLGASPLGAQGVPSGGISDSLRILYIARPAGWEHYALTSDEGGFTLSADYDFVDRGRRNRTTLRMTGAPDFAIRSYESARVTDTSRSVLASVQVMAGRAHVVRRGETTEVAWPATAYAVAGYLPTAQHLPLIRYWETHGRPATMAVVPGDPNPLRIRRVEGDAVGVGKDRVRMTRYTIDGTMWGTNYLWLDDDGRLAMFATGGGAGLSFKTIRAALLPYQEELLRLATRAQMEELRRISAGTRAIADGNVALVGATVVDATGEAAIPNATVVVRDGRIVSVGPSAGAPVPAGARRIDVTGKTIVPGLWDSHAHLHQVEWIPTYLAAGVTTVRDMGSEWPLLVAMRKAIDSGTVPGPTLHFAGLIDGPGPNGFGEFSAATPEEGRALVRRYHALGFEMIKIYMALAPEVQGAICREAHALGMWCTGHVPASMSLRAAIDSGQDQIAHFPFRADPASDSGRAMIAHFVEKGTVFDPTASWGEIGGKSAAEPMQNIQPILQRLPVALLQEHVAALGRAPVDTATAHARLAKTLAAIKAVHDAGVPIIAGTDEGIPGFSIYRELELYVKAGFTPMEALRAATAVAARAMHVDHDVGTIERGKRADLLVLDANPLDDISNIRRVRYVMARGRLYDDAALWRAAGFRPE